MMRNLPPLPWLRAFEASARHLSFTQAAAELGLTQAAVSKQVKNLELRFQERLFVRKARSLVLTKVGEAYLPKVASAFERLSAGTHEVFGRRRTEIFTIRGAVGFATNWLASRLPEFLAQHPDIPVRIISSVWNEETEQRTYDLDVRYGTGKWSGYESHRLTWEKIFPVCSPTMLTGKHPLMVPLDLRDHNLLHVLGYADGWANWLSALNEDRIDAGTGLYFDTSNMAFEVAVHGGGVALARSSMVQSWLDRGALVAPFEQQLPIDEAFHVLMARDVPAHPHAPVFLEWLLEQAAAARDR